ncbi:MAG: NAD-dependent epimerase/dehydratase family protein [Candidatus Omnitrophica bacterium]|nr:NAD-dependent epimerase/dehydratase family protein [Candidatus Omnitrophota bacterium]
MKTHKKVFLITGGFGFLGPHLVQLLLKKVSHCAMYVVGRKKAKLIWKGDSRVKFIYGDLRDAGLWAGLPKDITHVFHLAAVIPWGKMDQNRTDVFMDNVLPISHLIGSSRAWPGLRQVIYSSSISVYARTNRFIREGSLKDPPNVYGAAKLEGEILLQNLIARGIKVTYLRYSSIYGHGHHPGTVLPVMLDRALKRKEVLVYGTGNRTQDFLYCEDAANANLLAYEKSANGVFNIGCGVPVSMRELAHAISDVFTNGKAKLMRQPAKKNREPGYKIDISRAKRALGYRPTRIKEGLRRLKKDMERY